MNAHPTNDTGPAHSIAHHFDDAQQQFDAAQLGMWLFLATEVLFFDGMFGGYFVYRMNYPDAFAEGSHHLNLALGAINTAVLLCSSLTMALAVHAAQTGKQKAIANFILLTIVLGAIFLGIKVFEYSHKFAEHLVPGASFHLDHVENVAVSPNNVQLFFSFYFAMTGMHALHMVVGIGMLSVLARLAARGHFSPSYYTPVEMVGLLVVTVAATTIEHRVLNTILAITIAVAKAVLIVLFFMHVKYSNQLTQVVACAGFLWLMILILLLAGDYQTRDWPLNTSQPEELQDG